MFQRVLCGGAIVEMTGSHRASPIGDQLNVGRSLSKGLQVERVLPLPAFERVGSRATNQLSLEVVSILGIRVGFLSGGARIDLHLRPSVITNLKRGIFEEVQGMHFVMQDVQVN